MKPAKNLNGIFWVIEYWFKALAYKIWSTNTKPFSWESEKNLETLHKLSAYIGVSYKFVLKSVKGLNRISRVIEYWFKALECRIWLTSTKPFFWVSEGKLKNLQKLSPYLGVSYKFALKSVKSLNRIFWVFEYWFKALECQLGRRIQNHVSGKPRQSFKLSKNFFPILGCRINLFRCLSKAYIESPGLWNIGSRL